MVHGKNQNNKNGQDGRMGNLRGRYGDLSAAPAGLRKKADAPKENQSGINIQELLKKVFSAFTPAEISEAEKIQRAYQKYAQKLSEKYHVHMKESRIAKLRAAHRAHEMDDDAYTRELKALMKTRPGDLDITEEISFA